MRRNRQKPSPNQNNTTDLTLPELPSGWICASLSQIGVWRGGGTPSKSADHLWRQGTIPWVSPKDMKTNVIEDALDKLNESARGHPSLKLVPPGSVLIVTRSGILKHSLPVAITATEVAINQDIKALIPHEEINPAFVASQLRAEADRILHACVKAGTTVESLDFDCLRKYPIRIAPLNEQVRIVAKLDPLLARCALVRLELARVERLAVRQRVAALTAAFRGSLNHAPRDAQAGLLGWNTVSLSSLLLGKPSNGVSPRRSSDGTGTLSLKLSATTTGELRLDEAAVKRVQVTPPSDSKYWLKPGDLLVQRANALEYVGAAAIFDGEEQKYIYPDLMMKIRIEDEVIRRYVWRYLNSPTARRYFQENATGTAGNMPKITGRVLAALPVPLAPRDQMGIILKLINKLYARLEGVKKESRRCSRLVDKLEAAFLRRAFSGRLVGQDPEDVSPGAALERATTSETKDRREEAVSARGPRHTHDDGVRTYIERQMSVWPPEGIAFEQLRAEAPGSYEELKDLVFELMGNDRLGQRYDARERKMKLVRRP